MNWRTPHRMTGLDMLFLLGFLIGAAVVALGGITLALWAMRQMVGG